MLNQTISQNKTQPPKGFLSNFLKLFAAMTMLVDHAALTLVFAKLAKHQDYLDLLFSGEAAAEEIAAIPQDYLNLYSIYTVMRLVGRIAFPLFAFLLFEGFLHTSNYKRYLLRIGILAIVSEIPYNLMVSTVNTGTPKVFYPQLQNTVFTLFLALVMLYLMKRAENDLITPAGATRRMLLQFAAAFAFCIVAYVARTDYSYMGILLIAVFYFCKNNKKMQILLGATLLLCLGGELTSLLAFIPIWMYNGILIPSKKFQYFFYIFYPAHLLVLFLLSLLL